MVVINRLSMVSFFKVPPPVSSIVKKVSVKNRNTIAFQESYSEITSETNENEESVVSVSFDMQPSKLHGSGYLFCGQIELHKVSATESIEDENGNRSIIPGLRLVIKKYTGEWAGTVVYDYVNVNGLKCIDNDRNCIIRTIHHIQEEKYFVYVNYGDNKVVLHMELCPGDEEILNKCLKEYERDARYARYARYDQ